MLLSALPFRRDTPVPIIGSSLDTPVGEVGSFCFTTFRRFTFWREPGRAPGTSSLLAFLFDGVLSTVLLFDGTSSLLV